MRNAEVAKIFYEIADILEIQGITFKPYTYRKAAQSIASLKEPIETVNDVTVIPGVGEALGKKIQEILETGTLTYLEKLKKESGGAEQLLQLPGVGPKTAHDLARQGITSVEALKIAIDQRKLQKMKGMGPKTEKNLKRSIELYTFRKERHLLHRVLPLCQSLKRELSHACGTVVVAGSVRRWNETAGNINVLAVSFQPESVINLFTTLSLVEEIVSKETTKACVILKGGIQSDLRVIPEESFGSALQYYTGSKEHNIKLRKIASQKGFTLYEHGLFDREKKVAGKGEKEIYHALGLQYIPPELREDRGEIEAAQTNSLPDLVDMSCIKGDLHMHTDWSDGHDSIEAMAEKAHKLGYQYIGIADHSQSLTIANGLSKDTLLYQHLFIKELYDTSEIAILSGVECDILPDGSLDYPDSVLEQLDFVIASVHSRFKSAKKEITTRVTTAMENPLITVLAHPTGRIIGKRDPLPIDMEELFKTAVETETALEINCYPDRLDLKDTHIKKAKEYGVTLALGTDAHAVSDLDYMELGVKTARRGWAEPETILNTLDADSIKIR
jgi:DNA polymerase (family 10)